VRRSRTALLSSPHLDPPPRRYVVRGPADNIPVGALQRGKHSLSSQADPRRQEPRPTLRLKDTPRRESDRFGVRPRFSLRPYANRRPRGHRRFNTGIASACPASVKGVIAPATERAPSPWCHRPAGLRRHAQRGSVETGSVRAVRQDPIRGTHGAFPSARIVPSALASTSSASKSAAGIIGQYWPQVQRPFRFPCHPTVK
jgi:hypothetical protein